VPHRYLIFNKPFNVLSQFTDTQATENSQAQRSTLKDFIPIPEVYPVGRLDHDSEGLMLLTSHGELQHHLSHPKFAHPRTYWVQVENIPTDAALDQLRRGGLSIQNYLTRPTEVDRIDGTPDIPPRTPPIRSRQQIPTAWIKLTLTEGHNRQVRRMTAAVGFPTLRLIRISIAHITLNGLEPGEWRDLTPEELDPLLISLNNRTSNQGPRTVQTHKKPKKEES
jgi:23S rRNA pseudouridine2457 synthase